MRRLLTASLFCFASQAAYADVMVSQFDPNTIFSHGSVNADITYAPTGSGGRSLTAAAGQFSVKVGNAASALLVFCTDILHNLSLPGSYTQAALTTSPTKLDQLNALFSHASSVVQGANATNNSAGMQLAIWEVLYESAVNGLDVGNGEFKSSTTGGATTAANLYLGYITNSTWTANNNSTLTGSVQQFILVSPSNSQKLSFYEGTGSSSVDVPEPASMALLGVGLFGLGMVRRRSNRA